MEEVRTINKKGQLVCSIEFNGAVYKRYPNGKHAGYYYHKWKSKGKYYSKLLHHAVYESVYGEIPKGHVVHHKDGNPLNNNIENLQCVTISEHSKIHRHFAKYAETHKEEMRKRGFNKENWHSRRKLVEQKLQENKKVCKGCGKEFAATNTHQKYCSIPCYRQWRLQAPECFITKVCPCCGKEFRTNKYYPNTTCSKECGIQYSANTKRENYRARNL